MRLELFWDSALWSGQGIAPPEVVGEIERTGLSVEEFALVSATLFPAYLEAQLREGGGAAFDPAVADHQIRFVEENHPEIERLVKRVNALR